MINSIIEEKVKPFLQKDIIIFTENGKPIKDGKLLLFKFKEFYLNFSIKKGNTIKIVELPYPFLIQEEDKCLRFSYNINDFSSKNEDLQFKLLLFKPEKPNKLYNSTVVLSSV
jgi:hypothetical protein